MTEEHQDFTMYEGEAKTITVTEVDSEDISGQDIEYIIADEPTDDPEITKDTSGSGVSITDGANGEFEIELEPSDTQGMSGQFYHEARLKDGAGTQAVLFTGEVQIRHSVTA